MLSIPDMALLGAAALMLFGPEQLPRVARKAGNVMREIQNTSQSFIREMERAADLADEAERKPYEPPAADAAPYDASAFDVTAPFEAVGAASELYANGATPHDEALAPWPAAPDSVAEKLAEPRSATGAAPLRHDDGAEPFDPPPP